MEQLSLFSVPEAPAPAASQELVDLDCAAWRWAMWLMYPNLHVPAEVDGLEFLVAEAQLFSDHGEIMYGLWIPYVSFRELALCEGTTSGLLCAHGDTCSARKHGACLEQCSERAGVVGARGLLDLYERAADLLEPIVMEQLGVPMTRCAHQRIFGYVATYPRQMGTRKIQARGTR